ncbi:unnamed protein product [Prorocentrum cordatum]|uniref:Uncharacterized protein n=1 Tax=Prorocentrum cordatum TaxID=2364126 RepID=A0ABN9QR62_9DINO|nr:unnamed protein product [Polarella glacialis]
MQRPLAMKGCFQGSLCWPFRARSTAHIRTTSTRWPTTRSSGALFALPVAVATQAVRLLSKECARQLKRHGKQQLAKVQQGLPLGTSRPAKSQRAQHSTIRLHGNCELEAHYWEAAGWMPLPLGPSLLILFPMHGSHAPCSSKCRAGRGTIAGV